MTRKHRLFVSTGSLALTLYVGFAGTANAITFPCSDAKTSFQNWIQPWCSNPYFPPPPDVPPPNQPDPNKVQWTVIAGNALDTVKFSFGPVYSDTPAQSVFTFDLSRVNGTNSWGACSDLVTIYAKQPTVPRFVDAHLQSPSANVLVKSIGEFSKNLHQCPEPDFPD